MGEELFPDAVQILDLHHLEENIYGFGKHIYSGEASLYTPWAEGLIAVAKESRTEALLERLKPYKDRELPAGVLNLYKPVNNNRDKIDYAEYKKKGYYAGKRGYRKREQGGGTAAMQTGGNDAGRKECPVYACAEGQGRKQVMDFKG
jgi:hypothetical protein